MSDAAGCHQRSYWLKKYSPTDQAGAGQNNREGENDDLQEQLATLKEEKLALQPRLDDFQIALSVSQCAHCFRSVGRETTCI